MQNILCSQFLILKNEDYFFIVKQENLQEKQALDLNLKFLQLQRINILAKKPRAVYF